MNFSIRSSEFYGIMKKSKSLSIGDLSFKYTPHQDSAIGFIVSKHYGNAVERNLFKRRCRSLFYKIFIKPGASMAIIIRPNITNISYPNIEIAMESLYEKICV